MTAADGPRAYVAYPGDILESLDGKRRVRVIDQGGCWGTYRLRNVVTWRLSNVEGNNLYKRYRVVSRGAEPTGSSR